MFHCKIDDIFKEQPYVFGTAEDILIAGYGGKDSDRTLRCCYVDMLQRKP